MKNVTWRDLGATYTELTDEITRRQGEAAEDQVPIYVFIYDIQRFRDLRKSDDDFGFSSRSYDDEPKADPPAKMFANVLRDGPPVGLHTIVWCDSVNNLNRTFDRKGMKEFENRILFQMSANDSSTLIDMPGGEQAGREPGPVLQRGREPDREVPPVRPARAGVAGQGEGPLRLAAGARGGRARPAATARAAPAPAPTRGLRPSPSNGAPTATATALARRRQRHRRRRPRRPRPAGRVARPGPVGDEPGGPPLE